MVRIAMKNVNKRVEQEVSPAKAGLLTIDPKLVLHSSTINRFLATVPQDMLKYKVGRKCFTAWVESWMLSIKECCLK